MEVIIFGAGDYGRILCKYFIEEGKGVKVIGLIDTYSNEKNYRDVPIFRPDKLLIFKYDFVIISMKDKCFIEEAKESLDKMRVPGNKVKVFMEDDELKEKVFVAHNPYNEKTDKRVWWLNCFSRFVYDEGIKGEVAECGVFRGEFAYYINKFFPDRECYLFDTFEGFDNRDIERERNINDPGFICGKYNDVEKFSNTNERIVMKRMLNKERIHLIKGYFPQSATKIGKIRFGFVNLDMDLYQPMYEGLRFFSSRMVNGGIILLHDYYNESLPGVKKAVHDYEKEYERLKKFPIGDECSIAVVF